MRGGEGNEIEGHLVGSVRVVSDERLKPLNADLAEYGSRGWRLVALSAAKGGRYTATFQRRAYHDEWMGQSHYPTILTGGSYEEIRESADAFLENQKRTFGEGRGFEDLATVVMDALGVGRHLAIFVMTDNACSEAEAHDLDGNLIP